MDLAFNSFDEFQICRPDFVFRERRPNAMADCRFRRAVHNESPTLLIYTNLYELPVTQTTTVTSLLRLMRDFHLETHWKKIYEQRSNQAARNLQGKLASALMCAAHSARSTLGSLAATCGPLVCSQHGLKP